VGTQGPNNTVTSDMKNKIISRKRMTISPVTLVESEKSSEDNSIIRIFSLQNKMHVDEDEDSVSELKTYINNMEKDELQAELPRRIFNASRIVAQCIAELDKDEYGDYVYREKDMSDEASQRLKKASDVLKFWLNLLKSVNKYSKNLPRIDDMAQTETADKEVQ